MYSKFGQFIDGKWQEAEKKEKYEVINPAKEEEIGKDMLTKKLNEMLNGDDTLKPLVMIDPMMDPMVITKETKV